MLMIVVLNHYFIINEVIIKPQLLDELLFRIGLFLELSLKLYNVCIKLLYFLDYISRKINNKQYIYTKEKQHKKYKYLSSLP